MISLRGEKKGSFSPFFKIANSFFFFLNKWEQFCIKNKYTAQFWTHFNLSKTIFCLYIFVLLLTFHYRYFLTISFFLYNFVHFCSVLHKKSSILQKKNLFVSFVLLYTFHPTFLSPICPFVTNFLQFRLILHEKWCTLTCCKIILVFWLYISAPFSTMLFIFYNRVQFCTISSSFIPVHPNRKVSFQRRTFEIAGWTRWARLPLLIHEVPHE